MKLLGTGAEGDVFLVTKDEQSYALKIQYVLEPNKDRYQMFIDMKTKVADALMKIKHPNIQQLLKYEYVGVFLFLFEYVDLSETDVGALEGEVLMKVVKQLCSAV